MVWYAHLFQNFPQFIVIHTVKGFGIVNKAEIDVFLELSCFSYDPADVGNLISWTSGSQQLLNLIWILALALQNEGRKLNSYRFHLGSFIHRARPMKMIQHGVFDHCLPLYWIFILTNCAWYVQLKWLTWSAMAGIRCSNWEQRLFPLLY